MQAIQKPGERSILTEWLPPYMPRLLTLHTLSHRLHAQQSHKLLPRQALALSTSFLILRQRSHQRLPPVLSMPITAKDTVTLLCSFRGFPHTKVVVIHPRRLETPLETTRLLVPRHIDAAVAAQRTHVPHDERLANRLIDADALAVEPVLAHVAGDHPPVVVRAPAQAVRPVVRLVVLVPVLAAGFARGWRRGR